MTITRVVVAMMRFSSPPTLPKTAGYSHVVEVPRGRTSLDLGQFLIEIEAVAILPE